ncbi:molybdopterin cofactor-binding domain-containing protein, partial [Janthinobacterium sp. UMAB-56]|uniref:molybdopterin cofactor-binding domain-containing protein n=1 Tax=Janthinobacterium sp. UMAB-56 TaxID=1365361 RepID=UPI001C56C090
MFKLPKETASGHPPSPGRRGFLIAAAGTGFTLAFLRADTSLAAGKAAPVPPATSAAPEFDPSIWFQIGRDGIVTVNIAKAEMGQHIGTALARIVAEELEVDWSKVRLHYVDTDPKWGLMVTGGSWSVWQNFDPLSRAGAAGRLALV